MLAAVEKELPPPLWNRTRHVSVKAAATAMGLVGAKMRDGVTTVPVVEVPGKANDPNEVMDKALSLFGESLCPIDSG